MQKVIRRRRYDLSTQSNSGALRRLVVSLLGLFVLTFNVAGAGAMPPPNSGVNAPFAQALLDDRIVICTAAGMVVMDKNGNVVDVDADGHADFCVFCLPLMHGGTKVPSMVVAEIVALPVFADEISPFVPPAAKPVRLDGASSPRAPPVV